jgi:hypothetical protein
VVLALVLAVLGIGTTSARANVYWSNYLDGSIGRASIDGTSPSRSFVTAIRADNGVAVDGHYVYWANSSGNAIGRANRDGTRADQYFVSGTGETAAIAIHGNYLYWTDYHGGAPYAGSIGRVKLDGTGADPSYVTGANGPAGIAVDDHYVYWANNNDGTLDRASIGGVAPIQHAKKPEYIFGANQPTGVAVDAGHVYWSNFADNSIGRADLDGTNVNQRFIVGANRPYFLTLDAAHLYWANFGSNTIARANLDGSDVNEAFISGASEPVGIAVDQSPASNAPSYTSAPAISGDPIRGQSLHAAPAGWLNDPSDITLQWLRCDSGGESCVAITGATNRSYTLADPDAGSTIRLQEIASNAYGTSLPATSAQTAIVVDPPAPPPWATTAAATAITQTSAILNSSVDPHGRSTAAHFDFAVGDALRRISTTAPQLVPTGLDAAPVAATLTGLSPDTRYAFRVAARDTITGIATTGAIMRFTTLAPLKRVHAPMTWSFDAGEHAATVKKLQLHSVPAGAHVHVTCSGKGCPYADRTRIVTTKRRKPTREVDLQRPFRGRHLEFGSRLTVRVTKTGWVGESFTFPVRRQIRPRIACLAPGSATPGRDC